MEQLTEFVRSYLETALWSSTDDNEEPLDKNYDISDFAPETLKEMIADCEDFQESNFQLLQDLPEGKVAHDFWLTRNRHGAGFWDGDYPEDIGEKLTDAAHVYGSCDLYVGHDGLIHCSSYWRT